MKKVISQKAIEKAVIRWVNKTCKEHKLKQSWVKTIMFLGVYKCVFDIYEEAGFEIVK